MGIPVSNTSHSDVVVPLASKLGMSGGVLATFFGWLSSSGAAVLIGISITILGFWVNFYFLRRKDLRETEQFRLLQQREIAEEQRKQELHNLQVARLKVSVNEPADQCQ